MVTTGRANAMWDFSWLERRYEGGGYEDWGRALDGLVERGYDAVRIDCYPHLVGADSDRTWTLTPCWTEHDWGAPFDVEVAPGRGLVEFLDACAERDVAVMLSSWFRDDTTHQRLEVSTPEAFAGSWIATLELVESAGHLDSVLFVDLANEFALSRYNAYLYPRGTTAAYVNTASRLEPRLREWMSKTLHLVRTRFPQLPLCYSFCTEFDTYEQQDVSEFDLLELHIWMTHPITSRFNDVIGFDLGSSGDDPAGYRTIAERAEAHYRDNHDRLIADLASTIDLAAAWSDRSGLPIVTTESWSIITFKDGPGMDWGWVKESCAEGVALALETQRWASMSTSNFCGPQYAGMWDDIDWHQALTTQIKRTPGPRIELPTARGGTT